MTKEEMVALLNGDLKNEWKHLRFYLYHASAIVGLHREEYREYLLKEAASEMLHVTQFSDLIYGLDGQATQESNSFPLLTEPKEILEYALEMEKEVVDNYVTRMHQAENDLGGTDGQWIHIFLEGQVQKSREDVDNLKQILRGL